MRNLKQVCLLSAGLAVTAGASAQTVSGRLVDENKQPLPYANVVLLSLPDSAFVSGTVSGEDGSFALASTAPNQLVRISSIGYATQYKPVSSSDMGVVQLVSDTQLIGEVVVKADLPKMRLKGDAVVTTVEGSLLEKAGTGENLLNKISGVSAEDGEVNVFGAGAPEIYINGRKVRDNSELDQLSSDQIKRVEVVKNPGARYDASVKAVIRIVTKKAAGEGFGFNDRFVLRNNRAYGWTVFDQFNFNYRKNGFDLSGMLLGGQFRGGNDQQIGIDTHLDKLWHQELNSPRAKTKRNNVEGNVALNYQFNEKHSMGARYGIDRYFSPHEIWPEYTKTFTDGQLYETSVSQMELYNPSTRHNLNYYYNGQVGEWNIDFNADGQWKTTKETQRTQELVNGSEEVHVNTYNENEGTLYAAKLVVSRPLWQGNLSFGSEYSHTDRTNLYLNEEGILANDDSRIKEGSVSAFMDYTRSFGPLSVQAGVRYEHVDFDYYEEGQRVETQSRTFDNVFPTLSMNMPIGKAQLMLSYSGGITRPSYDMLRNSTYYGNRYTYQTGNPFLKPTLTHDLQLAAAYQWVNVEIGYSHVKDDIMQIGKTYSEDNPAISLITNINASAYDRMTASLTLAPSVGWWHPQFTAMLYKQWFSVESYDGMKELNHPQATFVWRNNFELPAGILLDVDATCMTRGYTQNMYFRNNPCDVSLTLYKDFLKKRLSVQLQANNLFEANNADLVMYSGIRVMTNYVTTFRQVSLTLRYKFNAAKSKYKGTGAGQDQKNRM